jgi:CheY-like chemotaxis protein
MSAILLVDDDVDIVEANKVVLEGRGHTVKPAYSAAEAEMALEEFAPDIAVIDVMMEDTTAGFDLARTLHERLPAMPLIMLTGIHSATNVKYRFEPDENWLPVSEFLDKPVKPAVLADKVEALLKKKEQ